ncbi:MAG TPA: PilZ domain-containing protein [Candidatus Saccharimonadales bacterium]|nr:PilZ domain-containing protein [Candidatus Saccharimonadales bacterium]
MSEARTGKRFPLELPIRLRRKTGTSVGAGKTADLSASGVYIQVNTDLAVGTSIEFDITLPAIILGTPGDVEVRCTGRVVRNENDVQGAKGEKKKKKKNGVACVIDQYQFIRKSKGRK